MFYARSTSIGPGYQKNGMMEKWKDYTLLKFRVTKRSNTEHLARDN